MVNTTKMMGIVFTGNHDGAVPEMASVRALGSIPFGGRYRFVDFALSNMVNSGVTEVGLVTENNYQALMDHVAAGREWDLARKREGLHILPPLDQNRICRGHLESMVNAMDFLRRSRARYVIISDSSVIYNMDYRPMLEQHIESGADITVAYQRKWLSVDAASHSTIFAFDPNGRVIDVMMHANVSGEFNSGLNLLIIEKSLLLNLVEEAVSRGEYSFDQHIIQKRKDELKIFGYSCDSAAYRITTMRDYYHANLSLLDSSVREKLFPEDRPVFTKIHDEVPVKYGLDSTVRNCLMADGCIVEGQVENSILFRGVHVQKGAVVKDSILLQGTTVGKNCEVHCVIADKDVMVRDGKSLIGAETYPIYISKGATV